jgi:hypothetical protein
MILPHLQKYVEKRHFTTLFTLCSWDNQRNNFWLRWIHGKWSPITGALARM